MKVDVGNEASTISFSMTPIASLMRVEHVSQVIFLLPEAAFGVKDGAEQLVGASTVPRPGGAGAVAVAYRHLPPTIAGTPVAPTAP